MKRLSEIIIKLRWLIILLVLAITVFLGYQIPKIRINSYVISSLPDTDPDAVLLKKIGAQFGGKCFAHDVRVIRMSRHAASCPIALGVSCSADRNILAKIDRDGLWVEQLEQNPGRFIPERYRGVPYRPKVAIDLNRPMKEVLADLSRHPVATMVSHLRRLLC